LKKLLTNRSVAVVAVVQNNRLDLGFDYSINSPGLCLAGRVLAYLTDAPSVREIEGKLLVGLGYSRNGDYAKKSWEMSSIFQRVIAAYMTEHSLLPGVAVFEAYSISKMRGGQNRLLQIAEVTGTMKAVVSAVGFTIKHAQPNTIKSVAGFGHASKEEMADFFAAQNGWYPHEVLGCEKGDSPASDVVDAFFAWKSKDRAK
jgi:hypothetical protein